MGQSMPTYWRASALIGGGLKPEERSDSIAPSLKGGRVKKKKADNEYSGVQPCQNDIINPSFAAQLRFDCTIYLVNSA